uniref:Uncharacterized protein n=1 Tax=Rhizophora mucronata TaxID=61149 RepID=A0A2P2PN74_RHIMU
MVQRLKLLWRKCKVGSPIGSTSTCTLKSGSGLLTTRCEE